jgi:hypothetical protein
MSVIDIDQQNADAWCDESVSFGRLGGLKKQSTVLRQQLTSTRIMQVVGTTRALPS